MTNSKLPNDRVNEGIEVRYHRKSLFSSAVVILLGTLFLVAGNLIQSWIIFIIGFILAISGSAYYFVKSSVSYFIYSHERILMPPYSRDFIRPKRKMFIINSPDDILIKNNKLLVRYENDHWFGSKKIFVHESTKGEPKKVIAHKSRAHPDDWEKFENWVKDLQRQVIKH